MHQLLVGLGSNEGDRLAFLYKAIQAIEKQIGKVVSTSSVYETEPWGFEHETQFLNQAILVETILKPEVCLSKLLAIEQDLGRIRLPGAYYGRTIDTDILFYDNEIIDNEHLTVPHPHITERRFVLAPLVDIVPEFVHPIEGKSMKQLLTLCLDKGKVNVSK